MDFSILLHILLYLNIISFILGYILSSIKNNNNIAYKIGDIRKNKANEKIVSNIEIQDDKYVVSIDTSNMEKKYESLGEVKKSEENISSSVNKLKNLKG